jgi:hypothetical protein
MSPGTGRISIAPACRLVLTHDEPDCEDEHDKHDDKQHLHISMFCGRCHRPIIRLLSPRVTFPPLRWRTSSLTRLTDRNGVDLSRGISACGRERRDSSDTPEHPSHQEHRNLDVEKSRRWKEQEYE